jgi:hypothetical protein
MKFFAAALLACALPAFGQGVPEQLAGQLHDKCVAHAGEILRRDWHISSAVDIDTARFCECADKGVEYVHLLALVAKLPELERQPGSRPSDALESSYFLDGLQCYSHGAGWSHGLPAGPASRSLDEVRGELDRHKGTLYSAYNQALKRNPKLAGKVSLEFAIDSSGRVRDVKVSSSEIADTAFLDAIKSVVEKLDFPNEPVAQLIVTYPLDFIPK